jgi:hypothetical protein
MQYFNGPRLRPVFFSAIRFSAGAHRKPFTTRAPDAKFLKPDIKGTNLNCFNRTDKKDYANIASLKDLMSAPPMTAEQYWEVIHKRREQRRMVEAARELKTETQRDSW